MKSNLQQLDRRVRHLIRAVEPQLREHLGVSKLDRSLVSDLYLRLREALSRGETSPEELALTIYLVAMAAGAGQGPDPELLVALRRRLAHTADPEGLEPAPELGESPPRREREGDLDATSPRRDRR